MDSDSSNEESVLTSHIKNIFKRSRNNYRTRKIKVDLEKLGYMVSRRISIIMKQNLLVSNYTASQYKVHTTNCNESSIPNIVDSNFDNRDKLEVSVSDLTCVRVAGKWHYVCTLIELYNREIIGYEQESRKMPIS